MPASDPVEILLASNLWATRNLLSACAELSEEQFHRRFDMGPGSLHDTLTHVVGAMRGWGDLLAGRELRPRPEGERHTPARLREMLDEAAADLETSAKSHPVDGLVTRVRDGRSYTFARGAVLTHVTTHGMHHRAQCLNMLRQLGVEPLPQSAVVEWVLTVDGGNAA